MERSGGGDLVGTVWRREEKAASSFDCPRCGAPRGCSRVILQRHLTALGRPLFRFGRPALFNACDECGHAFAAADSRRIAPVLAEDEVALVSVMAAVMLSDAAVRESEREVAGSVLRWYTGKPLGDMEVAELLTHARAEWGEPIPRLARLALLVPMRMRRSLVSAAYLVCTADGDLHPQESRLLDRAGEALDLGPREVRRAIEEARTAQRSGRLPRPGP